MLIGLNGSLQSGKDTTFGLIKELYPHAERVSFADPLKDSAAASLNISRDIMEQLKNKEDITLRLVFPMVLADRCEGLFESVSHWSMNLREFLQRYGTEAHRDIFGENFWVDRALPPDTDHSDRLLVVTDVRFPNEATRIKDLGGVLWKVQRDTVTQHSKHPSEQNLDDWVDVFIDNTGSLDELRERVKTIMNRTMVPC